MKIDLPRGKLLRILGGAGSTVGQTLKLRRPGLALVEAISDAAVSFGR